MSSGAASRRKGLTGEREVARVLEEHGWDVRGLEATGDALAVNTKRSGHGPDRFWHIECKRYGARARWPEWWQQASGEASSSTTPLLCTRADRGEWLVTLRLADLLDVIA